MIAVAECQLRGELQRWMATVLTIVGVLTVSASLVVYFVTDPIDGRLNGLGQLDTHVIAALVYGVILLFVLRFTFQSSIPISKVAGCLIALVVAVAVAYSDSRNAWVSVALGVLVMLLAYTVRDNRQFVACVVIGGLILAALLLVGAYSDPFREFLFPRGDSFRIVIWTEALHRLDGQLLGGLGILTSDDITVNGIVFQHPHSMYLAMLYQGGLIALALYLAMLCWTLSILVRHYYHEDAKLALGILSIALSAHLLDGHELVDKVGASWFLIWLPVAMAVGLSWSTPKRHDVALEP